MSIQRRNGPSARTAAPAGRGVAPPAGQGRRCTTEIERVVCECCPEAEDIDITLLEHVSPIEWDNVLLYGQYVIDRSLIRVA